MAENYKFDFNKELDKVKKDRNILISTCGAVAVIVGIFLPWYTFNAFKLSYSVSLGLNGAGILLLVLAVVTIAALLNVLNKDIKTMLLVAIVASALTVLVVLSKRSGSSLVGVATTGLGYWVTLAGSVAMTAGAVLSKIKPISTIEK